MTHFKISSLSIKRRLALAALVALTLAFIAGTSTAVKAEYPTGPVTLMVGFSPGGSTDMYARAFASFSHEYLGMPMVVINKPGATGMIAAKAAYGSRPDGHTLLVYSGGGFFIKAGIDGAKAPVVPMRDLKPLGGIGQVVTALVVPRDSPFKSAKDLVDYAKAHPDKRLRWSHPGRGSSKGMSGMLFLKQNGIKAQDVPFKGGSKARNAVAAKQVDFSFVGVQLLAGFESKLRALGVMTAERDLIYKDIPTMAEQGLPVEGFTELMIIWGSSDLPKDVVAKLQEVVKGVASSEGYTKMTNKMGIGGSYFSPEEVNAEMVQVDKLLTPFIEEITKKK